MAKYKLIKRQDAGLKITAGNSGETSINLSNEIADFLCGESLGHGVSLDVSFILYKEDFIKALCIVLEKLPLFTTSSHSYKTIDNVLSTYSDLTKQIESFFGEYEYKKYTCAILRRADGRIYLNGLRQDKFSIRDFLIEDTTYLKFEKDVNGLTIRLVYNLGTETSEELIVSNNIIRSFVFACIEYFSKTDKWNNITD